MVKKREVGCCIKKKMHSMLKFLILSPVSLCAIVNDIHSWTKNIFLNLKLIKKCSGYHFHYFLVSRDRYTNEKY